MAIYKAVVRQEGDWWIGWIEEIAGVNCQEKSREELLETLKITLREALDFNRQEAIEAQDRTMKKSSSLYEAYGACWLSARSRLRTPSRRGSAFMVAQSTPQQEISGPRQKEMKDPLVRKICKDLGIKDVKER